MMRLLILLVLAWSPLASAGYAEGQAAYERGDYATAHREWLAPAEQGHAQAQYRLGALYESGLGVSRDFSEASRWYRRAARQGHTVAQHMVGLTYAYGLGVPQDVVTAHMWLDLAAASGDANAGRARDSVATGMSAQQLAAARRRARAWQATP
jgi:hypothetical protein